MAHLLYNHKQLYDYISATKKSASVYIYGKHIHIFNRLTDYKTVIAQMCSNDCNRSGCYCTSICVDPFEMDVCMSHVTMYVYIAVVPAIYGKSMQIYISSLLGICLLNTVIKCHDDI